MLIKVGVSMPVYACESKVCLCVCGCVCVHVQMGNETLKTAMMAWD